MDFLCVWANHTNKSQVKQSHKNEIRKFLHEKPQLGENHWT